MNTAYIISDAELDTREATFVIIKSDGSIQYIPIDNTSSILLAGQGKIHTSAIHLAVKSNISLQICDTNFSHIAVISDNHRSGVLLQRQVQFQTDYTLPTARSFLKAGHAWMEHSTKVPIHQSLDDATNINELLGYEGQMRIAYYAHWKKRCNLTAKFSRSYNPVECNYVR